MFVGKAIEPLNVRMLLCLTLLLLLEADSAQSKGKSPRRCLRGYKLFSSHQQDFCFRVVHKPMTFQGARKFCYAHRGHLAEPRSHPADVALTQAIQDTFDGPIYSTIIGYWIAMKKRANTVDFKWMYEGTDTGSEGYSQWKANQNIHGRISQNRCAHKTGWQHSKWVAGSCQMRRFFVCEDGRKQAKMDDHVNVYDICAWAQSGVDTNCNDAGGYQATVDCLKYKGYVAEYC